LSRPIEGAGSNTQDITLTATEAQTFSAALEILTRASMLIAQNEAVMQPRVLSIWGSPCMAGVSINQTAKVGFSSLFSFVLRLC
jgi:hypothetical protein